MRRLPLLAACALGAVLALPAAAAAAIAYAQGGAVMVADDAGQGARRVAFGRAPVIAPDGAHLALLRRVEGAARDRLQLVLVDLATGGEVATGAICREGSVRWAPDATRVACVAVRNRAAEGITVVRLDGTARVLEAAAGSGVCAPSWAPDATRVAWSTRGELRVRRADGRGAVRALGRGWCPVWGPARIAFERGDYVPGERPLGGLAYRGRLWTVDPARGAASATRIGRRPIETCGFGPSYPVLWTPDGTGILIDTADPATCSPQAARVDVATGAVRPLGSAGQAADGAETSVAGISADGAWALLEGYDADEACSGASAAPLGREACRPLVGRATAVSATAGWQPPA